MRIILRAAMAAMSIANIGSAYAGEGGGSVANTLLTQRPGVVAEAPVQNAPPVAIAQNGQAVRAYVTHVTHSTWLVAPNQTGGSDNG